MSGATVVQVPGPGRRGPRRADLQPGPGDVAGGRRHQAGAGPLHRGGGRRAAARPGRPARSRCSASRTASTARSSSPRTRRAAYPAWARSVTVTYPSGRSHPQLVVDELATAVWAVQMNTVTFHPWPVRTEDTDRPDELRIDLDPQPGTDFADAVRAAHALRDAAGRARPDRVGQDLRQPRACTSSPGSARRTSSSTSATPSSGSPASSSAGCRSRSPPPGGRRSAASASSSTSTRPTATARSRRRYSPRPLAARAGVDAGRLGRARRRRPAATSRCAPCRSCCARARRRLGRHGRRRRRRGHGRSPCGRPDVHERGLGEMPFPPDYPKMPGEPPRVQPSRAKRPTSGNTT